MSECFWTVCTTRLRSHVGIEASGNYANEASPRHIVIKTVSYSTLHLALVGMPVLQSLELAYSVETLNNDTAVLTWGRREKHRHNSQNAINMVLTHAIWRVLCDLTSEKNYYRTLCSIVPSLAFPLRDHHWWNIIAAPLRMTVVLRYGRRGDFA